MNRSEKFLMHIGHEVTVEVTPLIESVVRTMNSARGAGSTKIAAVRTVFPQIARCPKEAIWYAIVKGVQISSRGAVTYYYLMKKEWGKRLRIE